LRAASAGESVKPTSETLKPETCRKEKGDRDDLSAKFWLDPVQLEANFGFRAHELRTLQSIALEQRAQFLEAWHEFFGSDGG
jgi:hypothetical protein